jgi:hypothetical protein
MRSGYNIWYAFAPFKLEQIKSVVPAVVVRVDDDPAEAAPMVHFIVAVAN